MALDLLEEVKPLVRNKIAVPGGPTFSAACFEGRNWSLAPLQKAGDEDKNPDLAMRVGQALHGLGAQYAYAPSPVKFNGKIIYPIAMGETIPLWKSVLYRNAQAPADGTWLPGPKTAGIFSAGGCSMIAVTLRHEMIFAHAGRDCVIDRERIKTRNHKRGRHHESVVNSIVSALAPAQYLRRHLRVWVFYSIKPKDFLHKLADEDPEHLKYNVPAADMLPQEYGDACGWVDEKGIYINVPTIIKAQFAELGVPSEQINLEHAYLADELPTTRNGGGRYLAAIVRHT
ncbi:MAG: hypothetical protein JWL87_247 [Candidatus Adlerbacteria bacterium]|nr:hypothetical protein [Candidatus Adlerbacteria bacterium]